MGILLYNLKGKITIRFTETLVDIVNSNLDKAKSLKFSYSFSFILILFKL